MNGNISLNEFLNELVSVIKKKFDAYDMSIKGMKAEVEKMKTTPNPGSNPNLNQVAVRNLETKVKSLEFSLNSLKNSLGNNRVDKAILKPLESEKK